MQKLQTENGLLRNEVEKLRDREHAWAPLVQAGLARGRKQANAGAAQVAAVAATISAPTAATTTRSSDALVAPSVSSAPQPKSEFLMNHNL